MQINILKKLGTTQYDDPTDYCEVFKNRYSKYINRIMQFLSNEFFNWQEYVELYIEKSIRKQVAILKKENDRFDNKQLLASRT